MPTQKRATRGTAKKVSKTTVTARRGTGLKSASASTGRRKRATTSSTVVGRAGRKAGVLKRAIKKGISELAKVGS